MAQSRITIIQKIFILLVGFVFFFLLISKTANATSDSPWLSTYNPTLTSDEVSTIPYEINGNIDCQDHKFVTRPYKITTTWPFYQTELSNTYCAPQTAYGTGFNNYLELNGTRVSGTTTTSGGTSASLVSLPNSKTALKLISSGGYFSNVEFHDIPSTFSDVVVNSTTSEVTYKLAASPPMLKDQDGSLLQIRYDSINSSKNGKWMVAYSGTSNSMLRVDLETHEALPFGDSFNYGGTDPAPKTAITNDGRLAIVYSKAMSYFKIFDLETCGSVPTTITAPVSCESKSLQSFLTSNIPNITSANNLRFINNDIIGFYAGYKDSSQVIHKAKYRMVAYGQTASSLDYLGLGDSFSSGEGAYSYFNETDSDENKCHLSQVSYPYLIGEALDLNSYESAACSGAKIENITDYAQYTEEPDPNSLGELLPGFKNQLQYVEENEPGIVTLTMSGNDIGFKKILTRCTAVFDTCFNSYEDRLELVREVNRQFNILINPLLEVKQAAAVDGRVYIVGYPHLAKENGNCALNVRLNEAEVEFSNQLIDYVNQIIEAAADRVGVRYVDVSDAFVNHRFCETISSNTAVNGVTNGNDLFGVGPIGNESYHPNTMGQRLLKDNILEETSNFTQSMPTPNSSAAPPAESSSLPILYGTTAEDRTIRDTTFEDKMSDSTLILDTDEQLNLSGMEHALKANTTYQVELHSDPVDLGTVTTDNNGDISAEINIPDTVPAGFHTLHVYGKNLAGEDIDIYKTIFVGVDEDDLDGDSILNENDPCLAVPPDNEDQDEDEVDDACDSYINDAPSDIEGLYRARNGDINKGEDAESIYIERSVAKANLLLGLNDVDSDSDGWAIVGKTDEDTNGTLANFSIEDKGPSEDILQKYIPHVSTEDSESECIQFRPTDLSEVTDSSLRAVILETPNTLGC